jgi:hypothetical protein
MARDDNPFFDLADYSAGPPRDAMYSGFVPGANPMARKAEQQRLMRESKQLTPAAALMRGLGEGYFGDITTPNAEQGYSVMDASSRAPAGREAEMQRYRDVGTALGIVADPATMLAPLAKPAIKAVGRGALATAKGMGEAMNNRMLAGESLIPGLPQAVAPNPLMFAIKPKGGNWRPALKDQKNDIEQAVLPLEQRGPTTREAAIAEGGQWRMQTDEFGNPYTFADSPEGQTIMANTGALNRWLNKKLKPYIQNELGTPDDPIRFAHEQGYSHMPAFAEFGEWLPDNAATMRRQAGFPEEGFASRRHAEAGFPEANAANAQSAENWENLSDSLIGSSNARRYQGFADIAKEFSGTPPPEYQHYFDLIEQNPWLTKAEPDTKIYELLMPYELPDQLGFKHMVDELRASLSPNSELPEHMRLTPDSLSKVSVADAVKRVSEINSWRALQAEKAEQAGMLENLNSNARLADPTAQLSFVEKPGMTWVDIPEVVDAKGTKLCTDIGRQGGWCTMNRDTAKEYGSGDNRLVALLDSEGRPHAQAMIVKSKKRPYDIWYEQNPHRSPENNAFMDWLEAKRVETGDKKMDTGQNYIEWAKETGRTIPTQAVPDIAELKPPGNAFSSDRSNAYKKRDPEYQKKVSESVVKFLNSGEWGTVDDLYHYDIFDLSDPSSYQSLTKLFGEDGADKVFAATRANGGTPPVRFMTRDQVKDFIDPPAPPAEGYAEGGAVHMQAGGVASLARRLFKTPVAQLGRAGIMSKSGKILTETFTPEELDLIQNSIVMSRRKTLDDLAGADKRLKSVHETNRTGAASGPLRSKQARAEREPEMFGGLGQAYGYLTLDPLATLSGELSSRFPKKGTPHIAPTSQIPEYGRFGLVLNPELRSRTTFTIDDSLDRTLGPQASTAEVLRPNPYDAGVAAPGSRLHELAVDYDAMLRDIVERLKEQGTPQWKIQDKLKEELTRMNKPVTFAELLRSEGLPPIGDDSGFIRLPQQIPRILDNPTEPSLLPSEIYQLGSDDPTHFRNKLLQRDPMGYVEAQVHGDVTPEHIQRIYDFGYEPSLKAEKQAKKLGIDYIPRPEAAYDIIKRENPQTMGDFYRLAEELGVLPDYLKGRKSDDAMLPFGGNYAKGGKVSTNPFDHLV